MSFGTSPFSTSLFGVGSNIKPIIYSNISWVISEHNSVFDVKTHDISFSINTYNMVFDVKTHDISFSINTYNMVFDVKTHYTIFMS